MTKLDEAKLNLKSVLERLESAIDAGQFDASPEQIDEKAQQRIKDLEEENKKLSAILKERVDEINYLREETSKLQANVGKQQETIFKLRSKNDEAIKRVDSILGETKSYLSNKGYL